MSGGAPSDPSFTVVQNCEGATLAPNASCAFTYVFAPLTDGAHSATTTFTVNSQSSGTITLTGTASSASPSASPSTGGTLADTGSPTDPLSPLVAVITLAMGALVLARRRSAR